MLTNQIGPREAASSFLQTVVVVDDRAYDFEPVPAGEATLGNEEPGGQRSDSEEYHSDDDTADEEMENDPDNFDTRTIVDGFADLGVSCSVLAPSVTDASGDANRLLTLALRSDVVVLDWTIRPTVSRATDTDDQQNDEKVDVEQDRDKSPNSLGLILAILKADISTGSRLRLICVYTGESDFPTMIGDVTRGISGSFPSIPVNVEDRIVAFGDARIVFLSKDRPVPVPGLDSVTAADLPSRVVQEFSNFVAPGLLPELALTSLSAVRSHAHRLLARFSHDLDPALLSHRALTSAADAHDFALSMIGDELSALASAAGAGSAFDNKRIERYVDARLAGRSKAVQWKGLSTGRKAKEFDIADAKNAFLHGVGSDLVIRGSSNKKIDKKGSLTSLLYDDRVEDAWRKGIATDYAFAKLSSLARDRAHEGEQSIVPQLQLGTILREVNPREDEEGFVGPTESQYWLCFQPLCDGVRLTGPTAFPLLPLSKLRPNQERYDLVARFDGQDIPLEIRQQKLASMDMPKFTPDEGEAIFARWLKGDWAFESSDARRFYWLGNVRLDKAHKLLHGIVNAAGRIGIDEYEYFRRISTG